jgi:thioredoxin 1
LETEQAPSFPEGRCFFVAKSMKMGYPRIRTTKEDDHMSAVIVDRNNFQEEVMASQKPVLLDFWASWCGPCRMVLPIVESIAQERPDIKVCKINVDEQPELAAEFGVMTIPTLVVMQDGKILTQSAGAKAKHEILAMLP